MVVAAEQQQGTEQPPVGVERLTPEEYLAREERAEFKSEFINGEILPVAGATANHNRLTGKFHARLLLALEDLDYSVFMSDMRVWLEAYGNYVYPDVLAVAGEPQFTDEKQIALTNPCLVVEVLSGSTGKYDHWDKFRLYRSLPEFKEYVLVDQRAVRLEHAVKVEGQQWLLTELVGEEAVLQLQSVPVEVGLKDLYNRVVFETAEDKTSP